MREAGTVLTWYVGDLLIKGVEFCFTPGLTILSALPQHKIKIPLMDVEPSLFPASGKEGREKNYRALLASVNRTGTGMTHGTILLLQVLAGCLFAGLFYGPGVLLLCVESVEEP